MHRPQCPVRPSPSGFLLGAALCLVLLHAGCRGCEARDSDDGGVRDGGSFTDGGGADAGTDAGLDGGQDAGPDAGADGGGDGGSTGAVETVTCGEPVGGTARCEVTQTGAGSAVALRGRILGPSTVWTDGTLLYEVATGRILCTGCGCQDAPEYAQATVLECADAVVSPGLINTHDHTTFSVGRPVPHGTERFEHRHDWRRGLRGHTRLSPTGSDSSREGVLWGELRMLLGGATSINGSTSQTNASGLLRNLDSSDTEGLVGVDVDYRTFPLGDSGGTLRASGCDYPHIDPESRLSNPIYCPHIAEGIDVEANNEFHCLSTPDGADLVESNTSIVHGIGLTAVDMATVAADGAKLIWSPRSNIDLYGVTAQVVALRNLGVLIALGTDWSTSGSMNMLRELRCADSLNRIHFGGFFSDYDLWMMATWNAAVAMGAEDQIGGLLPGYFADVAVFESHGRGPHRAVIEAEIEDVVLVLRGGQPLYGDAPLVEGLVPPGEIGQCETADVCGRTRRLCLERDAGLTLSQLTAAVGTDAYGLFFCGGAPPDEPSCEPLRPGEFEGPTPTDRDGDGVPDAEDLCPDVFDPVRPLDGASQADHDGDGIGDACDLCPTTPGETCTPPDPNDVDGDGVPNFDDVCPYDYDPDQTDSDHDGKGDACDACPNDSNPGPAACPVRVQALRNPADPAHPPEGSQVRLSQLTVTRVGARGFFAQDAAAPAPEYSGVYVFTQSAPTVSPGDVVDVEGTYLEYFDLSEVSNATVTVVRSGDPVPAPVVVTPDEVRTGGTRAEALESVLIQVQNVSVTHENPDDDGTAMPPDYGEFEVGGTAGVPDTGLRVDDFLYDYAPLGIRTLGTSFQSLTGPLYYSFGNHKLVPGSAEDIVLR
ncbi:MAG: hypothetical protein D6729_16655 [Deltaproteobacteria bacterium]|nr:MAG: hypothetical protein D6729_16655 [Deltaproteobacteria bacterium]